MSALEADKFDIAVVGGGASGLMAALAAARQNPTLKIVILERMPRVGKKLLATGNGRCNMTNVGATRAHYHGTHPEFVENALSRFPPQAVRDFFAEIGLRSDEEDEGRVYPASDQSSAVLDVLRLSLAEARVEERVGFEVCRALQEKRRFRLIAEDASQVLAEQIIFSTGGLTASSLGGSASGGKALEALGHTLTARLPALVQLKTDPQRIRALKGVKYRGGISIWIDGRLAQETRGEILFTDYGLSGLPAFELSRIVGEALWRNRGACVEAVLSILSGKPKEVEALLRRRMRAFPARPAEDFLTGLVHKRLGQTLFKALGDAEPSAPTADFTDRQIERLALMLTEWRLPVCGTLGFEQAQVTAGGVRTDEVDAQTMASKRVRGLYITGEALDIDGDCGGYNLQWAWASGMVAGLSAARAAQNQTLGGTKA